MHESHTIDASEATRNASMMARKGARYYEVDDSYDKRVYENTPLNYARITGTLFIFWIFNACHWWGVLSLGIVDADVLAYYSIAAFFFVIMFLGGLLVSGKFANQKKRESEFLYEKISEYEAERKNKETNIKQAEEHEAKIRAQA